MESEFNVGDTVRILSIEEFKERNPDTVVMNGSSFYCLAGSEGVVERVTYEQGWDSFVTYTLRINPETRKTRCENCRNHCKDAPFIAHNWTADYFELLPPAVCNPQIDNKEFEKILLQEID